MISLSIASCKKEAKESLPIEKGDENIKTDQSMTGLKHLSGDFIYYSDAAVLQTPSEVYGVIIDSMMHVLQDEVKTFKKADTDMVPVAIKGEVMTKDPNEEGWPYKVKIVEVINVFPPKPNDNNVIKIENQSN